MILVWLLIPCQVKLDFKWQGGWRVKEIKSPVNGNIDNAKAIAMLRILTVQCLQHHVQPPLPSNTPASTLTCDPPEIEHVLIPCDPTSPLTKPGTLRYRYLLHRRQSPSAYGTAQTQHCIHSRVALE